jgi:hypothetical protein
MGLIVYQGVLPDGVEIYNVYLSFNLETIFVSKELTGEYVINTYYRVTPLDMTYKNKYGWTPEIRVPFQVRAKNINQPIYDILYQQMKENFPNSQLA